MDGSALATRRSHGGTTPRATTRDGSRRFLKWPLPVVLLALVSSSCADEPRVGVVDIQKAFQHSPLVMVAALELKGDLGSVQRELKDRGRALAELQKEVRHGGLELAAEERAQIERRIGEESAQLAELQAQYRADLAAARKRQGDEMIEKVEDVAREIAREQGLALLVRRDDALYTEEGVDLSAVDITDQVVRALLQKINPTEIPESPPQP